MTFAALCFAMKTNKKAIKGNSVIQKFSGMFKLLKSPEEDLKFASSISVAVPYTSVTLHPGIRPYLSFTNREPKMQILTSPLLVNRLVTSVSDSYLTCNRRFGIHSISRPGASPEVNWVGHDHSSDAMQTAFLRLMPIWRCYTDIKVPWSVRLDSKVVVCWFAAL